MRYWSIGTSFFIIIKYYVFTDCIVLRKLPYHQRIFLGLGSDNVLLSIAMARTSNPMAPSRRL